MEYALRATLYHADYNERGYGGNIVYVKNLELTSKWGEIDSIQVKVVIGQGEKIVSIHTQDTDPNGYSQ
jgi:hypothetical protein